MFTGIVEEVGIIRRLDRRGEGAHLSIQAQTVLEGTRIGDSIAVSGACLTVVGLSGDGFVADCMPETLARTSLGTASPGTAVNLERSLAMGGRLGGHLVLGHIDATSEVLSVRREGVARVVRLGLPQVIRECVAAKGSIAVDGISLTVIEVEDAAFAVGIIPHTLRETTLREIRTGTVVNLEADVLARYVVRTLEVLRGYPGDSMGDATRGRRERGRRFVGAGEGLSEALLRDQGFI